MANANPSASVSELSDPLAGVVARIRAAAQNAPAYVDPTAERERRQAVHALAADLGARYGPDRATLDRFTFYHAAQRPVLARLRTIADRIGAFVGDGRGLVLYGMVGTGKDHLLAALLYAAADAGVACRWVNGQEVFGQFRDRMDTGRADEEHFRELCRPQVLAISDPTPPVGGAKEWDLGNFYRLVDRRYRAMRPTWLTVNATSLEDADTKLSEPIFDRLRDGAEMLGCFWPSHRERAK